MYSCILLSSGSGGGPLHLARSQSNRLELYQTLVLSTAWRFAPIDVLFNPSFYPSLAFQSLEPQGFTSQNLGVGLSCPNVGHESSGIRPPSGLKVSAMVSGSCELMKMDVGHGSWSRRELVTLVFSHRTKTERFQGGQWRLVSETGSGAMSLWPPDTSWKDTTGTLAVLILIISEPCWSHRAATPTPSILGLA